jgi:hypothetical protein
VLHDVVAEDEVECVVLKLDGCDVEFHVHVFAKEVAGGDVEFRVAAEDFEELTLGRDVEDFCRATQKVGFVFEVEVNEALPVVT